jgi:hypothetical protein
MRPEGGREIRHIMPFIRVNCPRGALTAEQKAAIDVENCFPRGVKISKLIGATQGPVRLSEALELGERMKSAAVVVFAVAIRLPTLTITEKVHYVPSLRHPHGPGCPPVESG